MAPNTQETARNRAIFHLPVCRIAQLFPESQNVSSTTEKRDKSLT